LEKEFIHDGNSAAMLHHASTGLLLVQKTQYSKAFMV